MDGFGVQFKTNYWDECFHRNKAGQMGIPMDSADNQLKNGSIILVLQILK
jgi:hypothetical protein